MPCALRWPPRLSAPIRCRAARKDVRVRSRFRGRRCPRGTARSIPWRSLRCLRFSRTLARHPGCCRGRPDRMCRRGTLCYFRPVDADELILISVDDHIAEPPDMFDRHVPARYKDLAPRVVEDGDGIQQWYYGDVRGRNLGLNAVAGKPPEFFNIDANRYEEMRPGCYDVHQRVQDMNAGRATRRSQFPELDRILRTGAEPRARSPGERNNDPGLQRLARRRVVRRLSRPLHPVRPVAALRCRTGGEGSP